MNPIRVQKGKEEDKKKSKKGLLSSLLSLFGKGASAGAGQVGAGTATIATIGKVGAGAGFFASKAGVLTAVLGGGAALAAVGIVGMQIMGGSPTSSGLKDQGFSTHARAARSVDGEEAQGGLQDFSEGIKFAQEGEEAKPEGSKETASPVPSNSDNASSSYSAPTTAKVDSYGNPLSPMKTGFGDSSSSGGGGGGGGGSGAVGTGLKGNEVSMGRAGKSKITGMQQQQASRPVAAGRARSARNMTKGGLNQLKAAAASSKGALKAGNFQSMAATAGKVMQGSATSGRLGVITGAPGVKGAGITAAPPEASLDPKSLDNVFTPPKITDPKDDDTAADKKKKDSCSEDNKLAMKDVYGTDTEANKKDYEKFLKTCEAKDKMKSAATAIAIAAALLVALNALGAQKLGTGNGGGWVADLAQAALRLAAYTMYAAILATAIKSMVDAIGVVANGDVSGAHALATVVLLGSVTLMAYAGTALVGMLAADAQQGKFPGNIFGNKGTPAHNEGKIKDNPANKEPDGALKDGKVDNKGNGYASSNDGKTLTGANGETYTKGSDGNYYDSNDLAANGDPNKGAVPGLKSADLHEATSLDQQKYNLQQAETPRTVTTTNPDGTTTTREVHTIRNPDGTTREISGTEAGEMRKAYEGSAKSLTADQKAYSDSVEALKTKHPDNPYNDGNKETLSSSLMDKPATLPEPLKGLSGTLESGQNLSVKEMNAASWQSNYTKALTGTPPSSTLSGSTQELSASTVSSYDNGIVKTGGDMEKMRALANGETVLGTDGKPITPLTEGAKRQLLGGGEGSTWEGDLDRADRLKLSTQGDVKLGTLQKEPVYRMDDTPTKPTTEIAPTTDKTVGASTAEVNKPVIKTAEADSSHLGKTGEQSNTSDQSGTVDDSVAKANEEAARKAQEEAAKKASEEAAKKAADEAAKKAAQPAADRASEEAALNKVKDENLTVSKTDTHTSTPDTTDTTDTKDTSNTNTNKNDTNTGANAQSESNQAAKVASKTGKGIGDSFNGLNRELGNVPGAGGEAGATTPTVQPPLNVEGPGSVDEEMKKLFGA